MIHLLITQVSEAERSVQSQVQTMVSQRILFSQKSVIFITCFPVLCGILLYKLSELHTVDCHQPPELYEKKMNASYLGGLSGNMEELMYLFFLLRLNVIALKR